MTGLLGVGDMATLFLAVLSLPGAFLVRLTCDTSTVGVAGNVGAIGVAMAIVLALALVALFKVPGF